MNDAFGGKYRRREIRLKRQEFPDEPKKCLRSIPYTNLR